MKSAAVGPTSGCLAWLLAFFVFAACLCPLAIVVGGLNATLQAEFVAGIVGPYLCPENSMPDITTYESTTTDQFGNTEPATAIEMQCVDAAGQVVRPAGPGFAFLWVGLLVVASLLGAAVLALLLAVPVGGFIARWFKRSRQGG